MKEFVETKIEEIWDLRCDLLFNDAIDKIKDGRGSAHFIIALAQLEIAQQNLRLFLIEQESE